ncbi:hypothetical protein GSI_08725 [Ganoderma sinense ZZ0214-1]|uniref:Large ribosomal subunit protein bL28c n=1 Tax=Ganoderma sinense ZZ0214-1 TaxID=1077348 RepID=A0A2G8S4J5_9APHY|nr:hypothetical protein GSI_08725 [Ganoderma sinense ZZ0214-1]
MFPSIPLLDLVSVPFKRAQQGLFHGKMKQFGNSVPNSKQKTRRTWLPNVHNHRLLSETLGQRLRVKVSTRALKTINKASYGGLDHYLLKTKPDLLGWEGMRLRTMVRDKREKVLREEQRQKALLEKQQQKSKKRRPSTSRAA